MTFLGLFCRCLYQKAVKQLQKAFYQVAVVIGLFLQVSSYSGVDIAVSVLFWFFDYYGLLSKEQNTRFKVNAVYFTMHLYFLNAVV